jgi:hypothetical protein
MNRARFAVAATLVCTTVYAGAALAAQATTSQPLQSVLAGKKFTPPIKGEAVVEYTPPVTKAIPGKNLVQTVIKVRNASAAPIARLQIQETWYDKGGAIVAGGKAGANGLLQPGEVQTITIETPYNKNMSANNFNFTHANGAVKPAKVKTLDAPASTTAKAGGKEPAAKPVTAKK